MKQKLLLLDSIGAFFSGISLYVVSQFESIFGISQQICNQLILFPFLFSLFSISAYLWSKHQWPKYIKTIALANLLYCCLTTAIMLINYGELSFLGISYFIIEIIILSLLAFYELKIAQRKN
ncbi:hypothetical protein [Flavobacterium sp.]|uniref:hypothetical protein n=1 Tax=Flavobacterium sp. TaxID=239 RepID=UPI003D0C3CF7